MYKISIELKYLRQFSFINRKSEQMKTYPPAYLLHTYPVK